MKRSREVVRTKSEYIVKHYCQLRQSEFADGFRDGKAMVAVTSRRHVLWYTKEKQGKVKILRNLLLVLM